MAYSFIDINAYKSALKTINKGLNHIEYIKKCEEADLPVPLATNDILLEQKRILKIIEMKINLQGSIINFDSWKKKLEE